MEVNLDKVLVDLAGQPLEPRITLGDVLLTAATAGIPEDQGASGEKKMKLYRLAQKISKDGTSHLTAEEVTMIKSRVNAVYPSPLLYGQVSDLIDPPETV